MCKDDLQHSIPLHTALAAAPELHMLMKQFRDAAN
jgi:hypothetical protein